MGFILTPSGNFKATQTHLYDKAGRAMVLLRKTLLKIPDLSVNAQFKLFDSMIKPILLYGSEVWGAYMHKFANNLLSLKCMLLNVNTLAERLHSRFCKFVLQVNKYASNIAVRCESGRYPLLISIICRVLKYYLNISKRKNNCLAKIAMQMHMGKKGSWFEFVKYIIGILGLNINSFSIGNLVAARASVMSKLTTLSQEIYLNQLKMSSKLKMLVSVKTKFRKEPYLHLLSDVRLRKVVTSVRVSCHKLPIETGRYKNINKVNRLCTMCNLSVGDEQHVFMECSHPILCNKRNVFLKELYSLNTNLQKLSRANLFQYILLFNDTSIIHKSATYFDDILKLYI